MRHENALAKLIRCEEALGSDLNKLKATPVEGQRILQRFFRWYLFEDRHFPEPRRVNQFR